MTRHINFQEKNSLIAYFSRTGNTEVIAKMIQEKINGDIFRIETVTPYPEDYDEATRVAKNEQKSNARPELLNNIADMGTYDLIFLGYPNWWGTMPMAVYTFLESSDFSGKMIVPFCTHEGSGLGRSVKDIKKCCPRAEIKNASPFRGSSVKNASDDVEKWLKTC